MERGRRDESAGDDVSGGDTDMEEDGVNVTPPVAYLGAPVVTFPQREKKAIRSITCVLRAKKKERPAFLNLAPPAGKLH